MINIDLNNLTSERTMTPEHVSAEKLLAIAERCGNLADKLDWTTQDDAISVKGALCEFAKIVALTLHVLANQEKQS